MYEIFLKVHRRVSELSKTTELDLMVTMIALEFGLSLNEARDMITLCALSDALICH